MLPTGSEEPRYSVRVAKEGFDDLLRRRIVANMKRAMADLKITSGRQLALRIGADPTTVTRYLAGTRTPGLDILYRLHRGLGISSDYFLDTPTAEERPRPAEAPVPSREPALRHGSGRK